MESKCDDFDALRPNTGRWAETIKKPTRLQFRGNREAGAFAIMFVPLLLVILAVCGLALNAGALYNRKVELSGLAKAVALAAAQELNGTTAGIAAAKARAKETAEKFTYQYGISVIWNDNALSFGKTPAGEWRAASDTGDAAGFYFAKVDTLWLGTETSSVQAIFPLMQLTSSDTTTINDIAIAGRSAINVLPIAICAMSEDAATPRTNADMTETELVEFGFRRGVSYDLMKLNPNATTPARFLVDAVSAPGKPASSFGIANAGPFACTGSMWIPSLKGGDIHVTTLPSTSPLALLYKQLNSRFDEYADDLCSVNSAPPDSNIMAYQYDKPSGTPWMVPSAGGRSALTTTERGRLETVADVPSPGSTMSGVTAVSFGPLWSYAKAVKYASYVQKGVPEPSSGYATFASSDWAKLYRTGLSATGSYQSGTTSPYNPVGLTNPGTVASPAQVRKEFVTQYRRVLNIPLLSCTGVLSGSYIPATVKGIGKFFMTVQATPDALIAEFAGTLSDQQVTGAVELYR